MAQPPLRGKPASKSYMPGPITFAFDARSKPQLEQALALEEKAQGKLFGKKPKVGLKDMEQLLGRSTPESALAEAEQEFLTFYYNHPQASLFFEALGRLLLQSASKAAHDPHLQQIFLFQAVDALSTSIQKGDHSLNLSAQGVMVSVAKLLGPDFRDMAWAEAAVHKEMMTMVGVKKNPNDFNSREKIVQFYLQGGRYYDALVQLAEYEKSMKTSSKSLYQQKKGDIAFRKAQVFQAIIDFYEGVVAGSGKEAEQIDNMGKLKAFTTRFNRDNRHHAIVPLTGKAPADVMKTLASLATIANAFYHEAIKDERYAGKHKGWFLIARNQQRFESPKQAVLSLANGMKEVDLSRMTPKQKNSEKLKLMESLYNLYKEMDMDARAEEMGKEISRLMREGRSLM
ncbi:MAG: hypothetical protein OEV94_08740 [Deltaproteobacteria bacterium]|nr:hypothetical protein [Deltaproteobacteria bacterium]